MARNKYPEITIEKILDVAQQLFLEQGYEHTTMKDIVDHLGGLTKGAIYHHFKSKDEIMDAVCNRMFMKNNPFETVSKRMDLNGLQKLQEVILLNQSDAVGTNLTIQSMPMLENPKVMAGIIASNRDIVTPHFLKLIEEGNRDGSIHTKYAKELSELLPLLTSVWIVPSVFPATKEEMKNKFLFIADMLDKMGIPLVDDKIMNVINDFFDNLVE